MFGIFLLFSITLLILIGTFMIHPLLGTIALLVLIFVIWANLSK